LADAVVVLAEKECPSVCVFRGVMKDISVAQQVGWVSTKVYVFSGVLANGGRISVSMSAQSMMAGRKGHLGVAGMPDNFIFPSFRLESSVSKSLQQRRLTRV